MNGKIKQYVLLHCHSHYSIGDSLLSIEEYVNWAKENGIKSAALTDHGNLCGAFEFNQECIKSEIKPLIGIESYCLFKNEFKTDIKRNHIIILAKNKNGYHSILKLLGNSMRESFYYRPIFFYEDIFKLEDVIISTACMAGRAQSFIISGKEKEAEEFLLLMKNKFKDDFYLECIENNIEEQRVANNWFVKNHKRLGIKCIWTTDSHYAKKEHLAAHDIIKLNFSKSSFLDSDYKTKIYSSRNLYLKTREQIISECKDIYNYSIEEFLDNTEEINSKVEIYNLKSKEVYMPRFSEDSFKILCDKSLESLKEKVLNKKTYIERLKHELSVIRHKKMEDYFLIVADICEFAKNNDIHCGVGRGSGGGSLVVYLLGITKIDPLKYELLFERFLNLQRHDAPDIDLDFDSRGRQKIEDYLKGKYGLNSVSHIISFGRFGVKGALRDTFRAYFKTEYKDELSKYTDFLDNEDEDFDTAINKIVSLAGQSSRIFFDKHKKLVDIARMIVGKIRHYSLHAGGVVISNGNLENYIPLMRIDNNIVAGFQEGADNRFITDSGLMKFDILGLNACSIISDTIKNIGDNNIIQKIIDDDNNKDVLKQFQIGNSFGVFQFEGRKITEFTKRVHPTKFGDLVAINALYRPAVITAGGLEGFLKNRERFDDNTTDPFSSILKETYGIPVFQEQIMGVFNKLGGLSLEESDEARHILKLLFKGKEDYTDFNKLMEKFRNGCKINTNYNDKQIDDIMEIVKQFSAYSFNKCISGDTNILVSVETNNKGKTQKKLKISELYEQRDEIKEIWIYDSKLKKARLAKIKNVYKTGIKETYWIIAHGDRGKRRVIRTTLEHRFNTENGWKELKNLKVGDKILIKAGNIINRAQKNAMFGKTPWNYKQTYKFSKYEQQIPNGLNHQLKSASAKVRKIHGHTGHKHSENAKQLNREATLKRYSEGRFPHTDTTIHNKVFEFVSSLSDYKFEKNYAFDMYSLDIAEPNLKIAIECNGGYFHADKRIYKDRTKLNKMQRKNIRRDNAKRSFLKNRGWALIELWEVDINKNFEYCKNLIFSELNDYKQNPWIFEEITWIEKYGSEETYDVEIDDKEHNYIANKFVVHNSHACCYAMVGYIMMYFKVFYPIEFFSSLLTNTGNIDSIQDRAKINMLRHYIIQIHKTTDIEVVEPDVNESDPIKFKVFNGNLLFPLCKIKGIGDGAAEEVFLKRPFKSFEDFIDRVEKKKANKRVVKALIMSGSMKFDDLIDLYKKKYKEDILYSASSLFESTNMLFGDIFKKKYNDYFISLKEIENKKVKNTIVYGFVYKFRKTITKKGRRISFVSLYDGTVVLDSCIVSNEVELEEGSIIRCKISSYTSYSGKYDNNIYSLDTITVVN